MKTTKFFFGLMVCLSIFLSANAQKKYAVLITGDYYDLPDPAQWYSDEYWNDTYLMWEMLVAKPVEQGGKGYSDDHVFVLFANGEDFSFNNDVANRYNPQESYPQIIPSNGQITDGPATKEKILEVFNGLATGALGYPQLTDDDFLFVWTFLHGIITGGCGNEGYFPVLNDAGQLYQLTDQELADAINQVPCNKRVFWMQGDHSSIIADNLVVPLWQNKTVYNSASNGSQISHPADDLAIGQYGLVDVIENEPYIVNNQEIQYHHGEFDFHMWSSTIGYDPAGNTTYYLYPYSQADNDIADNFISVMEAKNWEVNKKSIDDEFEQIWFHNIGNIASTTSIDWPTLVPFYVSNDSYRGLIGIPLETTLSNGELLKFYGNSEVHFLD